MFGAFYPGQSYLSQALIAGLMVVDTAGVSQVGTSGGAGYEASAVTAQDIERLKARKVMPEEVQEIAILEPAPEVVDTVVPRKTPRTPENIINLPYHALGVLDKPQIVIESEDVTDEELEMLGILLASARRPRLRLTGRISGRGATPETSLGRFETSPTEI